MSDIPRTSRTLTSITASLTAAAALTVFAVLTAMTQSPAPAGPPTRANDTVLSSAALDPPPLPSAPVNQPTTSLASVKNVVFVLADDLDWALFKQVPRLAALQQEGMTFTNQVVTDSLCCPSRASILRGQYIHNHQVVSNTAATGGGWPTFKELGLERDCLPVWLEDAGVTTGLFGKYLNDYPAPGAPTTTLIPPGWTRWVVPVSRGVSYSGYNYVLNADGVAERRGSKPTDFLNDVLTERAVEFIATAPDRFFLTLSTYNPHKPAPVAVRNAMTHPDVVAPRTPNYDRVGTDEPSWMRKLTPLSAWKKTQMDKLWRQRAQSAESVADSIDALRAQLALSGRADDTLIVLTSDNGYHAGAHRLSNGKRTAFKEDTVVPLIVIGPGVAPGARVDAMTSAVDLAPTFTELLGAQAPDWIDGRSLVPILESGARPDDWRTASLSESMGRSTPGDPDYQVQAPPSFSALRTERWLFVVYRDGERELYDRLADPDEMNNIARAADPQIVAQLNSQLQALRACAGASCRSADAIVVPSP